MWIREFRKHFLVESGIQKMFVVESGFIFFEIRNPGLGIRNSRKETVCNTESTKVESWIQYWDPESASLNRNSRLSQITLQEAISNKAQIEQYTSNVFHFQHSLVCLLRLKKFFYNAHMPPGYKFPPVSKPLFHSKHIPQLKKLRT